MKNLQTVPSLLISLLVVSNAGAQANDWQVVENLAPRTLISVEDMHRVIHDKCRFQGVVDGQLICEYGPYPFGPSEIALRRESIRAVRREHNNTLIGLAVGAGAGAVIGVSRDTYPGLGRGGSALVGTGVLGGVGAVAGALTGHMFHGKVIYRSPEDKTQTSGHAQTQDRESTNDVAPIDRIAAARSRYEPAEGSSEAVGDPTEIAASAELSEPSSFARPDSRGRLSPHVPNQPTASDNATLTQLSSRRPSPPFPHRGGYPRSAYPGMWMPEGSGRHAVIGAVVGFGLGAALGAKANTDQHAGATARASVLFGSFGALLGAVAGHGFPSLQARNRRRSPGSAGDDELASSFQHSSPDSTPKTASKAVLAESGAAPATDAEALVLQPTEVP